MLEGTSLVVQWLRIFLPMQGTWFPSLVGEPRCYVPLATKTACCNEDPVQPKTIKPPNTCRRPGAE